MNLSEVTSAIWEAKQTLESADRASQQMASLLLGRLRKVSPYTLAQLKRELSTFNAHRKEWKEDK